MKKSAEPARRSLHLTMFESSLTAGLLAMSIMTPFFVSIGLNQAEIALTQMIFTVVVSVLNIPTGWIADRFSRKWANIIGDFGVFAIFLLYSQAHTIFDAILCECALGVLMAFSQGVDVSLLRHFCYKITGKKDEKEAERLFRDKTARLSFWQYVATFVIVLLGGPIGAIDFRLAIALSGVPSLIGGIASIFIIDDSEKLKTTYRNPLKDMGRIMVESAKNKRLRLRIATYAIGREMTHGIIWIVTPLFLAAGVPLSIVSAAWAINSVFCVIGSRLAARYGKCCKDWQLIAIPAALTTVSMGVLTIDINIFTVVFYFLMGIVQGWTSGTLMPMVQRYAEPSEQTTVVSAAKVVGQLLYIPTVWIIGMCADIGLQYATGATIAIFLPLSILVINRLQREKRSDSA